MEALIKQDTNQFVLKSESDEEQKLLLQIKNAFNTAGVPCVIPTIYNIPWNDRILVEDVIF